MVNYSVLKGYFVNTDASFSNKRRIVEGSRRYVSRKENKGIFGNALRLSLDALKPIGNKIDSSFNTLAEYIGKIGVLILVLPFIVAFIIAASILTVYFLPKGYATSELYKRFSKYEYIKN